MTAPRKYGLRPMLPGDVPELAELFRASVEALTEDDYSPAQQQAWIAAADDEAAFAARLTSQLTLVASGGDGLAGFISLKAPDRLDMLYVHPEAAGTGVGTLLYAAIEKLAAARGATKLEVDASDSGRDFFQKLGFRAERRNTVPLGGEWLANTTMRKPLTGGSKP